MSKTTPRRPYALIGLIVAQTIAVAIFLSDVIGDGLLAPRDLHFTVELLAVLGLIAAVLIETRLVWRLWHHRAHLERQASLAAKAFADIVDHHFQSWGLTNAEQDVAHFMVKGCSIAEIARLRGSAEGTVKSHLNGIYRKARVANRGELLSLLIDDLYGAAAPQDANAA